MKLYRLKSGILLEHENNYYLTLEVDWDRLLNQENLYKELQSEINGNKPITNADKLLREEILPPILRQEVWASGVTYYRSRDARMEESKASGGGDFYDKVYDAERPELFFKATAARTVGSGDLVNIRKDSTWNVPEPELTLFINSRGAISGYTIGNDMSSRSIEGENPLYLPQAKTYDRSAALGPCIYVPPTRISPDTNITLEIRRNNAAIFTDSIRIDQIKRSHDELVEYLYRECSFPYGCFLMTGTGIIPPADFTLASGDEIRITIDEIGTLVNKVA
ncbi:MAG: fumarylacetoacetate hydrolase family protein [Adhaeribacter sp.]